MAVPPSGWVPRGSVPRRLPRGREVQVRGFGVTGGPAAGDDLGAGVEGGALGAVDMRVAEERGLPAAERVVGHRHGNRHVQADHPDRHPAFEPARRLTARREEGHPVAVRVGVDQLDRVVEIGVGKHDRVVLRPAERLYPLAGGAGTLVHVPGHGCGADERYGRDLGVVQDRVDGHLVAVHHVEHAVGQAGLGVQAGDEARCGRVPLARLENEGVAAGDRDRVHPHRHHRREVERRDAGADAQRLAEGVRVDAAGDLVGVGALEQVRDAAGELDDLPASLHLASRVGEDLAVLVGDPPGELLFVPLHQVAESEHQPGPPAQRHVLPALERLARGGHRAVHIGRLGQRDGGLLLAGGRVPYRAETGRRAGGGAAGDPVLDGAHVRSLHRRYRYGRWARLACSYSARAAEVESIEETCATGTSHQACEEGAGTSGSVSMWITVVRDDRFAFSRAVASSSTVDARSTSAPSDAALAARSVGSRPPSSAPVAGLRYRYQVPNRGAPTVSDSAPIEPNPPLSTRTTISLTPSATAVTSSWLIIRYEPSPTRTKTSRLGSASFTPSPPAISYPMHE